ncbi:MAG: hypothetical protein ACRC1T_09630 [Clostridium chrysemydis]|uniref:hypothetical protein n=1 Tax=Clostridium chrysemydis TaxID=2665504 RepID=UPI003F2E58C8
MDSKIIKVKSLPHEIKEKGMEKDVYVEVGIQRYVKLANKTDGLYTIGSCEGHVYETGHVLNDIGKKTIGWIQISQLEKNDKNVRNISSLIVAMDIESRNCKENDAQIVCVIDPFSGIVPMEYNKVFISEYMWNKYLDNRKKYSLIGIDELVILSTDGKVVGNYKNVYKSALLKSRLIMRDSDMEMFI